MGDLGFWRVAEADPERIALVDPDGNEHTAGELLAGANRMAHGLRALGLARGDTVATLLPNSIAMLEVYLAGLQIGLYVTPINHHLVGPEVAYIVADSDAKVVRDRRAVRRGGARRRSTRSTSPPRPRFAVGSIDGFRPYADIGAGQPDTAPEDRTTGQPMHYTSGTTGRPKGVKRAIPDLDPSDMGELFTMLMSLFGIQPREGNVHITGSPLYHTAVLLWTACALHMGHKVVLMDKWTPESMLATDRPPRRHHQPHGADPVPPTAVAARRGAGASTTSPRCDTWSTPLRRARPRSSAG